MVRYLITLVPDLSTDVNINALKGKIKWSFSSSNDDFVTKNINNDVLLTKYVDDFSYSNDVSTQKSFNSVEKSFNKSSSNSEYAIFSLNNLGTLRQGWKNLSTIEGFDFNSVQAALDFSGEIAYFFIDSHYVQLGHFHIILSKLQEISTVLPKKYGLFLQEV